MITDVEEEETIDLLELVGVLWHRAWLLVVCLIVGAAAAGIGTKLLITPQYEATSMIYIYSKTTSVTSLADLQIGTQLTVDFQIIATTREVVESAIDKLGLDTTYEELISKINISNPSNSRILSIAVTDPDPVLAANLSNTLADELRARIAEVMNTDEPSTVEKAVIPKRPVSPSVRKNAAIGGLALFLIAAAIIVVRHLLDDTIKTEDDVEKYLNQIVLAVIPVDRSIRKSGRSDHSKKRGKKSA
ncbi:MAG: polysaccharide export protein [Oscillospiraceae bacterium]|nr:polysaccharide export protein [Oscillospiraceae bacterium]